MVANSNKVSGNAKVNWKLKSSRESYHSSYVAVFDETLILPDRSEISFTRIDLKDFVSIVPVLNDNIVMLEVYRYPLDEWSLEVPSGHVDENETPENCALRELREEAGYVAGKLSSLGWYHPSTRSTQKAYIFLAEQLVHAQPSREKTEQIVIRFFPAKKVYEELVVGKISHAPTIIGLYKLLMLRPCLFRQHESPDCLHTKPRFQSRGR